MCKSTCQGVCHPSINIMDKDSKQSLEVMGTSNKMQKCLSKEEAAETTIENTGEKLTDINFSCAAKNIFKNQNFKERLLAIRNAIEVLEKSLSNY